MFILQKLLPNVVLPVKYAFYSRVLKLITLVAFVRKAAEGTRIIIF
jgi:hypothetical protein